MCYKHNQLVDIGEKLVCSYALRIACSYNQVASTFFQRFEPLHYEKVVDIDIEYLTATASFRHLNTDCQTALG